MSKRVYPSFLDQVMGEPCPHHCQGGGGGGKTPRMPRTPPAPPPPEKAATPKPVTEAATAARASQKDKAGKAAGIRGSILTDPMASGGGDSGQGKTLLGQ